MPSDGYIEPCRKHQINERWCVKHGVWEFYCTDCGEWRDHGILTRRGSAWVCPKCRTVASGYDDEDDVDELFERAKAAYYRERGAEQVRIRRESSYAYKWVQDVIGFLTAIANCFSAVWNSACYISTAVTQRRGQNDDCRTLSVLRHFRTSYIIDSDDPERLLDLLQYNLLAPKVIAAIEMHPDRVAIWEQVAQAVDDAVTRIDAGLPEEAYRIYKSRILVLAQQVEVLP